MRKRRRANQAGVTLIEMLVVVTIIALFAGLVGLRMWKQADKARVTAARAQINTLMAALNTSKMDTGQFPTTEQGLQVLRVAPPNAANWQGPYLEREVPNDPWGNPYVYHCPGTHNTTSYDLYSLGPDGREGNDDIDNWTQH